MKKSVLSMLAVAALVFGMTSCNGAKKLKRLKKLLL